MKSQLIGLKDKINLPINLLGKISYKKSLKNYLNQIWESESISIPYKVKKKKLFCFLMMARFNKAS